MGVPPIEMQDWLRNAFRPHFDEWVIEPINRLVVSRDALIGFIFMSCTIDYLAGFLWGKSTAGKNKESYKLFIDTYFENGKYDSDGLYDSLRNGLVHMFTIKNRKYTLTHNNPGIHLKYDGAGQIVLNAGNFRDELISAKNKYFDDVETNLDLMEKLIERLNRNGIMGPSISVIK